MTNIQIGVFLFNYIHTYIHAYMHTNYAYTFILNPQILF